MRLYALTIVTVGLLVAADEPNRSVLERRADSDFGLHDRNGDGFLNQDEMPDQLKADLSKWDTNRDNLISREEYKFYYAARAQNRRGNPNDAVTTVTVIEDEEDLDARPVVYRAGKLPIKELPKWFIDLDVDRDGQVALSEWYKAGHDIDAFGEWDRNNDGFITAEEALYKQRLNQIASAKSDVGNSPRAKFGAKKAGSLSSASDERGRKRKKGPANSRGVD
jgi:hypothetical protein